MLQWRPNLNCNLDGEVFDYKSANKEDEARSDIKCCGFFSNMRQAYFDVKVVTFCPRQCSFETSTVVQASRTAKDPRVRRAYPQRRARRLLPPRVHLFRWHGAQESLSDQKTGRETESETKPLCFCCFRLAAMQAELCAASNDTAVCQSHAPQEDRMRQQHRAGCRNDEDGLLTSRCQFVHITITRYHSHHHHHHHHQFATQQRTSATQSSKATPTQTTARY